MSDGTFSTRETAQLLELEENRLRYWAQTGFINPSGRSGGRPAYAFTDLIALRTAKGLLQAGFSLQHVRGCLERLREKIPSIERPLETLRVWSDGNAVLVQADDKPFEPLTGQGVLDFQTATLSARVAEVRALPAGATDSVARSGYALFLEACRLEDAGRAKDAERAYQRALEVDATLSSAWTNLGNLLYRRGSMPEARRNWERALEVDPEQPEARYNLAMVIDEQGDAELAIAEYRRVLQHSPDFADAHFNLALTLERVGGHAQARDHFSRFVGLCPDSHNAWTEAARARLA